MGFFLLLFLWAAVFIAAELLRPKPNIEDARPKGLGDFNFPTATEGRPVPIVWGRVKVSGPNVIWYGKLSNQAVKENVKTGVFSSEDRVKFYRYFLGLQMAICRGPVDKITRIEVDDRGVSSGRTGDGTLTINSPTLFGGDEFGTGGMLGTVYFYTGSSSQAQNSYLATVLGGSNVPAYRGTCHVVFYGNASTGLGGYVGNTTTITPWSFEVERVPDGLGMASVDPGAEIVNGQDANPMNVMYEIMTDTDWGLAIPAAEIDLPNFRTAASTAASEGNGFSMVMDGEREASDMLTEVARQIDATLFFDRNAGLWRVKLARDDYTASALDLYDENNIIELTDYSRQTWEETTNQVRLLFADQSDRWKDTYALAQDMANVQIQGGNISTDVSYPGVKNATLANNIVWRDLETLSYPLAKINFKVNREFFEKAPGDVFRLSWARLGITEVVFRTVNLDYGTLGDGAITVYAVQDIFATASGAFGVPTGTGWVDADQDPVALSAGDLLAFEAPRQMVIQDTFNPNLFPRIWYGGRNPGGGTITFQGQRVGGSSRPLGTTFVDDTGVTSFMLRTTLKVALGAYPQSTPAMPHVATITMNNNDPDDILASDLIGTFSASSVQSLLNIAYLGDITDQADLDGEFIGYEILLESGGNVVTLYAYRGLFHTTPKAHPIDTKVWFIGAGGNLSRESIFTTIDEYDVRLLGKGRYSITDGTTDPVVELATISRVDEMPLAPRYPTLNDVFKDTTSVNIDVDYNTELGIALPDGYGLKLDVLPRFWRVDDPIGDEDVTTLRNGRDYDDDTPTFEFTVTLDPDGTPITSMPAYPVSGSPDVDNPTVYVPRNDAIIAVGANATMPTTWRFEVEAAHTVFENSTLRTNPIKLLHDFGIASTLLIGNDDLTFGGFAVNVWSDVVTIGVADTALAFDIYTALPSSGILEWRLNGSTIATLIGAAATTGTINVAATNTVELRFSQAPTADQFFDITQGSGTENGYGVLLT